MQHILGRSTLVFAFVALVSLDVAAQVPGPAAGPDLSGRWQDQRRSEVTIDIARCAAGWCGTTVEKSGACGFKGLELAPAGQAQAVIPGYPHLAYKGQFRLREGAQAYRVNASAAADQTGRPGEIWMSGAPLDAPLYTRMMPLNLRLVRAGEPSCTSERPVS